MSRKISVLMVEQIKELKAQGKPIRKISEILGISRNTVRRYLRGDDNTTKGGCIDEKPEGDTDWKSRLPWQEILKKRRSGFQVNILHEQYCSKDVSYWSFGRALKKLDSIDPVAQVSIPQIHKAGEKVQVDYSDGLALYDYKTGKTRKTQLFCGVLAFSGYTFGQFSMTQSLASFIRSHEDMWSYFGGVAPYVVPDNLKAGVKKAHRYDPEINPTFCDFGNHCGFAVLPARPYRPRDKGLVETTIGAIQRSFYQQYREHRFYSLEDLNRAFARFLEAFNNKVMKDHGVSRLERFQAEKMLLKPLPKNRYELVEWKEAKVHPDCHIQIQHCYYSVPFKYVGQIVRVKKSNHQIQIFAQDLQVIASHKLSSRKGYRSTIDSHFPEKKLQACRFEIKQALSKAHAIGPKMSELAKNIFSGPHPLTGLRKAQGMLRCWGKDDIDQEAMEYAAGQCLTFAKYKTDYFRQCALSFRSHNRAKLLAPVRSADDICLHSQGVHS